MNQIDAPTIQLEGAGGFAVNGRYVQQSRAAKNKRADLQKIRRCSCYYGSRANPRSDIVLRGNCLACPVAVGIGQGKTLLTSDVGVDGALGICKFEVMPRSRKG